jgi:hypothetical protein
MPTKTAKKKAQRAKRAGKAPTTQASAFVEEEVRRYKRGSGTATSKQQAVAIGLSEARREGVNLKTPKEGKTSSATRKQARRDRAQGQGKRKPDPKRSAAAKKAARTRARRKQR